MFDYRAATPTVYPRVGGGNGISSRSEPSGRGLSPRGRGKQAFVDARRAVVGSIPAWAGETAGVVSHRHRYEVYPRVGGGNADASESRPTSKGLSPRGRGKPQGCDAPTAAKRSIPAWAGETSDMRSSS